MRKVLNKRVLRDLKAHWMRYLALGVIIALCMYIVISIEAASGSIIHGTDKGNKENNLEDGEFATFVELTDSQLEKIKSHDVTLEEKFSVDATLEDGSVVRVFKNRKNINKIVMFDGEMADADDEIVLERRYCAVKDISVGDSINIGGADYKVVGIATSGDYDAPFKTTGDTAIDSKNFGTAFVTDDVYDEIAKSDAVEKAADLTYAYVLEDESEFDSDDLKELLQDFKIEADDVDDESFLDYWNTSTEKIRKLQDGIDDLEEGADKLSDSMSILPEPYSALKDGADSLTEGISKLNSETDKTIDKYMDMDISNLSSFITADDNIRIRGAANDVEINYSVGLIAGVLVLILFTYVISVFIVHQIDSESAIIGTLYALGAKKRELITHYIALPVIVCFIAGAVGAVAGFSDSAIDAQMADSYNYFSIPDFTKEYEPFLLVYGFIMPGVVAALVNTIVISKKLSASALSLMRNEQKAQKTSKINLKKMSFNKKFQFRQFTSEIRSGFAIAFGIFFSMLLLFLSLNCLYLCKNYSIDSVKDANYEYITFLRFPVTEEPDEGYEGYFKTLSSPETYGYTFDTIVYGITDDNPYFDLDLAEGKDKVVMSEQLRTKLGLKVGDVISLKDDENDIYYTFEIAGSTDYSTQMCCFMNIDDARELFGAGDKDINVIFSDEKVDIASSNIYTTVSKENIEDAANIFTELFTGMVTMMIVLSGVVFVLVLYLMMNVMLDRAEYNISVMKVFGYKSREIRKLFLNSNLYIVAVGGLIAIPLAKVIMNIAFPYMVSNVAVNINVDIPSWWYVAIYLTVIVMYFILSGVLMRKIRRIVPAVALKNRE